MISFPKTSDSGNLLYTCCTHTPLLFTSVNGLSYVLSALLYNVKSVQFELRINIAVTFGLRFNSTAIYTVSYKGGLTVNFENDKILVKNLVKPR